jgi:hypothetical protein
MAETPQTSIDVAEEFFILGLTADGKQFRPSDWADRLSGAMSCFQPEGSRNARLAFSPYVRPTMLNGIRAVVVDKALQSIEPLAYHFVVDFAKDNDLQVVEACELPDNNPNKAKPAR